MRLLRSLAFMLLVSIIIVLSPASAQVLITPTSNISFTWPASDSNPVAQYELLLGANIRHLTIGAIGTFGELEIRDSVILMVSLHSNGTHKGKLKFINCTVAYMTTTDQAYGNYHREQFHRGNTLVWGRKLIDGGSFHVSKCTFRSAETVQPLLLARSAGTVPQLATSEQLNDFFFGPNYDTSPSAFLATNWDKFSQLRIAMSVVEESTNYPDKSVFELLDNDFEMIAKPSEANVTMHYFDVGQFDELSPVLVSFRGHAPMKHFRVDNNKALTKYTRAGMRVMILALEKATPVVSVSGNDVRQMGGYDDTNGIDVCHCNVSNVGNVLFENNTIVQTLVDENKNSTTTTTTTITGSKPRPTGTALRLLTCNTPTGGFSLRNVNLFSVRRNVVSTYVTQAAEVQIGSTHAFSVATGSFVRASLGGVMNLGEYRVEYNELVFNRNQPHAPNNAGLQVGIAGPASAIGNVSVARNVVKNVPCSVEEFFGGDGILLSTAGSYRPEQWPAGMFPTVNGVGSIDVSHNAVEWEPWEVRRLLLQASADGNGGGAGDVCLEANAMRMKLGATANPLPGGASSSSSSSVYPAIDSITVTNNTVVGMNTNNPTGMLLRAPFVLNNIGIINISGNNINITTKPIINGKRKHHNVTTGISVMFVNGTGSDSSSFQSGDQITTTMPMTTNSPSSSSSSTSSSRLLSFPTVLRGVIIERNNVTLNSEGERAVGTSAVVFNAWRGHKLSVVISDNNLTLLSGNVPFTSDLIQSSGASVVRIMNAMFETRGAVVTYSALEIRNNVMLLRDPESCHFFGCSVISFLACTVDGADLVSVADNDITVSAMKPLSRDALSNAGGDDISVLGVATILMDLETAGRIIDPLQLRFELHINLQGFFRNVKMFSVVDNRVAIKAQRCASLVKFANGGIVDFGSFVMDRNNATVELMLEEQAQQSSAAATTTCAGVGLLFSTIPARKVPVERPGFPRVHFDLIQSFGHVTSFQNGSFSQNTISVDKKKHSIASSIVHFDRANLTMINKTSVFFTEFAQRIVSSSTSSQAGDILLEMSRNSNKNPVVSRSSCGVSSGLTISKNEISFESCNFSVSKTSKTGNADGVSFLTPCQFLTASGAANDRGQICFEDQTFSQPKNNDGVSGASSFIQLVTTPSSSSSDGGDLSSSSSSVPPQRRNLQFSFNNTNISLACNVGNQMGVNSEKEQGGGSEECGFIRETPEVAAGTDPTKIQTPSPVQFRPQIHAVLHRSNITIELFHGEGKTVSFYSGSFSVPADHQQQQQQQQQQSQEGDTSPASQETSSFYVGQDTTLSIVEHTRDTVPFRLSLADVPVGVLVALEFSSFVHRVAPRDVGYPLGPAANETAFVPLQQKRTLIRYSSRRSSALTPPTSLDPNVIVLKRLIINVTKFNLTSSGSRFGTTKNDYRLTDLGDSDDTSSSRYAKHMRTLLLPGGTTTTTVAPPPQKDGGGGGGGAGVIFPEENRIPLYAATTDCVWINANPQPKSARFYDNFFSSLDNILKLGFRVCPGTLSVSQSESISEVPFCADFRFVLMNDEKPTAEQDVEKQQQQQQQQQPQLQLVVDQVRGSTRTLRWMIQLDSHKDTPAPLRYGFRIVPPTEPPVGQIQSDSVTHFRDGLTNLSRTRDLRVLPASQNVAWIMNSSVFASRASKYVVTTQVVFDEQLDPDRDYTLRINVSTELFACRYGYALDDEDAKNMTLLRSLNQQTGGKWRVAPVLEVALVKRHPDVSSSLIATASSFGDVAAILTLPTSGAVIGMALSRLEAIVAVFRCPTSRDGDGEMAFLESPLGWVSGETWGKFYRGGVIGNITVVATILGVIVALAFARMYNSLKRRNNNKQGGEDETVMQTLSGLRHDNSLALLFPDSSKSGNNNKSKKHPQSAAKTVAPVDPNQHIVAARHTKMRNTEEEEKSMPFLEALAKSQFPSLLIVPMSVLLQGTVSAGAAVLFRRVSMTLEEGAGPNDRFVGGLAIGLHLVVVVGFGLVVGWRLPKEKWVCWRPTPKELRGALPPSMDAADLRVAVRKLFPECDKCAKHVKEYKQDQENRRRHHLGADADAGGVEVTKTSSAQYGKARRSRRKNVNNNNNNNNNSSFASQFSNINDDDNNNNGSFGADGSPLILDNRSLAANFSFTAFDDPTERARSNALQPRSRRQSLGQSFVSLMMRSIFFISGTWVIEKPNSKTLAALPRDPEFLNRFGRFFMACEAEARWYPMFYYVEGIALGLISGYLRQSGVCSTPLMLITSLLVSMGFVAAVWLRPRRRSTANFFIIFVTAMSTAMCICGLVAHFWPAQHGRSAAAASTILKVVCQFGSVAFLLVDAGFFFFLFVAPRFPVLRTVYLHYRFHLKPSAEDDPATTLRDLMQRRDSQLDAAQLEEKSRLVQNRVEHFVAPRPETPRKRKALPVCWDVMHDHYVSTPKAVRDQHVFEAIAAKKRAAETYTGDGGDGGSPIRKTKPNSGGGSSSSSPRSAAANTIGPRQPSTTSIVVPNRANPKLRSSDVSFPLSPSSSSGIMTPTSGRRASTAAGDIFNKTASPNTPRRSTAALWSQALGISDISATPSGSNLPKNLQLRNNNNNNASSRSNYDPILDGGLLDDDDDDLLGSPAEDLDKYFAPKASDSRGGRRSSGGGGDNNQVEEDIVLRRKDDTGNWSGPEVRDFANKASMYALL